MKELCFHRDLYATKAVREAVERFASYATLSCDEQDEHVRVTIGSSTPAREERIALELGNFALGLTITAAVTSALRPST